MSIAFLTEHHRYPWSRQLVDRPIFGGAVAVTINRIDADCELLVAYDDIAAPVTTLVPRARRFLIMSEPPGIKTYRAQYVAQFGAVLGPIDPNRADVHWHRGHPGLPWFYGIDFVARACVPNLSFEQLAALAPPAKTEIVSVVISKKTGLPMHRERLAFVGALKARLGSRLVIFGSGFDSVPDKAEAIAPHAYHLVLENNDIDHFWTEKTADAYLGWALPIFSGCRNLDTYFPPGSFIRIDPSDIGAAVTRVEAILADRPYAARLDAIAAARHRLLNEHELGAMLQAVLRAIPRDTPLIGTASFCLRPNRDLGPAGRLEPMARAIARRLLRRR